jgi:hypothetical protein
VKTDTEDVGPLRRHRLSPLAKVVLVDPHEAALANRPVAGWTESHGIRRGTRVKWGHRVRHAGLGLPEEDPADPVAHVRAAKKAFSCLPSLKEVDRSLTFSSVRNPYTRARSAYRDKAVIQRLYAEDLKRFYPEAWSTRRMGDTGIAEDHRRSDAGLSIVANLHASAVRRRIERGALRAASTPPVALRRSSQRERASTSNSRQEPRGSTRWRTTGPLPSASATPSRGAWCEDEDRELLDELELQEADVRRAVTQATTQLVRTPARRSGSTRTKRCRGY